MNPLRRVRTLPFYGTCAALVVAAFLAPVWVSDWMAISVLSVTMVAIAIAVMVRVAAS